MEAFEEEKEGGEGNGNKLGVYIKGALKGQMLVEGDEPQWLGFVTVFCICTDKPEYHMTVVL